MRYHILHIITDLSIGGAEIMLYKLLSRMDKGVFSNQVVSLTSMEAMADRIEALGVDVQALDMRRGVPDPRAILKLKDLIQQIRPDIIQTWMYHSDLMGGFAARLVGSMPVIWNIRHSNLDPRENKKTTLWTAKACAFFSKRIPDRIVCCSEVSRRVHARIGYNQDRMLVVPNGFDLDAFQPDKDAGESVRRELGFDRDALLIGMVARFNPQKDHHNLVQAAGILKDQGIDCHFVLCGNGIDQDNTQLTGWIRNSGLEDRFFLLGLRDDISRITAGLDIAVLSSAHGEGFPNVLGEAMACEVPCVATDVGDSAEIIADTGVVVPPGDSEALGHALKKMMELGPDGREKLGKKARQRVGDRFELAGVAKRYEDIYREVLAGRGKSKT
jgi:glycosyltransferase involved in cell wall biosynthesis